MRSRQEIGEGVDQDLAGEVVGGSVVVHRGEHRVAAPLALELVTFIVTDLMLGERAGNVGL